MTSCGYRGYIGTQKGVGGYPHNTHPLLFFVYFERFIHGLFVLPHTIYTQLTLTFALSETDVGSGKTSLSTTPTITTTYIKRKERT